MEPDGEVPAPPFLPVTAYFLEVDSSTWRSRWSRRTMYTESISSCFALENKLDELNEGHLHWRAPQICNTGTFGPGSPLAPNGPCCERYLLVSLTLSLTKGRKEMVKRSIV